MAATTSTKKEGGGSSSVSRAEIEKIVTEAFETWDFRRNMFSG